MCVKLQMTNLLLCPFDTEIKLSNNIYLAFYLILVIIQRNQLALFI